MLLIKNNIAKFLYYFVLFFILTGNIVIFAFSIFFSFFRFFFKFIILSIINIGYLFNNFLYCFFKAVKKFFLFFSKAKKIVIVIKKNKFWFKNGLGPFYIKIKYFILGISIALFFSFAVSIKTFVDELPNPKLIGLVNFPVSTVLYDVNGNELYEFYKTEKRRPVLFNDIPQHVINATIAAEDRDYFRHKGVSIVGGIMRALKEYIINGKLQGGSTITQQLVKTSLLSPERSFTRKIKEIIISIWTERVYSKKEILTMYFNQVSYGGCAYGIEEASRMYFGKSVKDVTLGEAAMLAGLPKAPSYYSPFNNIIRAQKRRNSVLKLMYKSGYISEIQYKKEIKKPLSIKGPEVYIKAPHFVFFVREILEKMFGERRVFEGGLRVKTTIDLKLQEKAEKILQEELKKIEHLNVTNGALLILNPKNGDIIAMVGSKSYFSQPYGAYNAALAFRQPGSAIKPILYSFALLNGYTLATPIIDGPVTYYSSGTKPYSPVNYDGLYHGIVTVRYALANSYNIPAVKILYSLGIDKFVDFARKVGISSWDKNSEYGLSIALGGKETRLIELATAYSTIANYGYKVMPNPILEVTDYKGKVLYKRKVEAEKVLDERVAFLISDVLSDNKARQEAFGRHSSLEIPGWKVAVKTGTTNAKRDNFTIGYTRDLVVAVWVGNNDNSPMNPFLASGVTGAAPIWNRVMLTALNSFKKEGKKLNLFEVPNGIIKKKSCYRNESEYFIEETYNPSLCTKIAFEDKETF